MSIGKRVRAARELRGFTSTKLASETGISLSYISRIEHDRSTPITEILIQIAKVLGVKTSYLLGETEDLTLAAYDMLPAHLREFVVSPDNTPWLEAAYQASKKGLNPKILTDLVKNLPGR